MRVWQKFLYPCGMLHLMSNSQPPLTSLTLAAYGWSPANWLQMFYPDDLPQDWQIAYYANEFNSVLLPASGWESPVAQAAAWHAEVGADFSFYLEITHELLQAGHWSQVQEGVEQYLATQVMGLLVDADALSALPLSWQQRFALHIVHPERWLAVMPAGAEAQLGVLRSCPATCATGITRDFRVPATAHRASGCYPVSGCTVAHAGTNPPDATALRRMRGFSINNRDER